MEEPEKVVFHFLDSDLYSRFIDEMSLDVFVTLVKQNKKLCNKLFVGCRVNKQSLKIPNVKKKIDK